MLVGGVEVPVLEQRSADFFVLLFLEDVSIQSLGFAVSLMGSSPQVLRDPRGCGLAEITQPRFLLS
jgi:hypothetical protein